MAGTQSKKTSTQKELIAVMLLSIVLGLGGGYVIGLAQEEPSSQSTNSKHESSHDTISMSDHGHGDTLYEISADDAPELEIIVVEDAVSGYNIELKTTKFTFTPGDVNGENVMNEGHAHIYIDGEKVARVYGKYFHYDNSFEGTKTFSATLNANDHSRYAVDGKVLEAKTVVTHDSSSKEHAEMHNE